jgi:hypothetical protein
MAYGRGRDMDGHTIFWIIQIILLTILGLILLTPSDKDIKDYFERQEEDDDK